MQDSLAEKYLQAANLISNSRHLMIFTGAGISTPSGIPDFRSQNTGMWQKNDPMEVASATAFYHHPDKFYNWLRPLLQASQNALPNPAHIALAELEKMQIARAVITQNIDGLHQKAGSENVIELHGSMRTFYCPGCRKRDNDASQTIDIILSDAIPRCKQCASILKPDVTLYEELLPERAWSDAEYEVQHADVMLIAGSSLEVVPASSLPLAAYQNGCRLIIVNLSSTHLDDYADVALSVNVAEGIPKILEIVKSLREQKN
jgi:NAD-dependent deacetylase